jgi:3-oxoacyl-(acyl-carrier-protein) synthase
MKRRRVKITGIGPVTPAGIGREGFWKGILEPVSRVRPYTELGEADGPLVAAYLDDFNVARYVNRTLLPKGAARHTLFAAAGAMLALKDAGLTLPELRSKSCAVVTGSSLLDFGGIGNAIETVHRRGARGALPRVVYTTTLTSVLETLNNVMGITARTMALQTSCCSGMDAIGYAANLVADGEVDVAVCGGVEAPLHRFPILELRAAGLTPTTTDMPERIARPFDLWRTTGVVSEGAAMLVLEPEESRRAGYSYLRGYASANDGPDELCDGIGAAARLAIADAGLRPSQVEAINAWGPGHKLIDAAEARAMIEVFGEELPGIPACSIKGAIGSPLGAAPAIQVAVAALAQRDGVIPPTVNWKYPDPEIPFNLSGDARSIAHSLTLVNAHGVGKVNACVVLERCPT